MDLFFAAATKKDGITTEFYNFLEWCKILLCKILNLLFRKREHDSYAKKD